MKILVIDDNENITKLLERFLKIKEHECIIANSGRVALELTNQNTFDAIILDLAMPDFTGIDFLKSFQNNGRLAKNKIVVLTASNISKDEEQNILQMGAKAVLRKPTKLDVLMDALVN